MPRADHNSETDSVAAAVIEREGRFLLGRRPRAKRHGGLWEFPGGKLRSGEALKDGIARELREELGLGLDQVGPVLLRARDPESSFEISFVAVAAQGTPIALEHTELAWRDRAGIARLRLAPADERFAREYLRVAPAT